MVQHLLVSFCMVQLGGCVRAGFDLRAADGALPGDAGVPRDSDGPRDTYPAADRSADTTTPGLDVLAAEAVPVSCGAKYGDVGGYVLCGETAETCVFFFKVSGGADCESLCTQHGGTCKQEHDSNGGGQACVKQTQVACTESHADAICTCTR